MKQISIVIAFGLFFLDQANAVNCMNNIPASNPDSAYMVHGDGTATDTRTGLMWKVCAEGQTWSAGTCTGTAVRTIWGGALGSAEGSAYAGYSDWRLPNLKELRSLVEECRVGPAINDSVFPGTPSSLFASGSPAAYDPTYAWLVSFDLGDATYTFRDAISYSVRLVRGGQ